MPSPAEACIEQRKMIKIIVQTAIRKTIGDFSRVEIDREQKQDPSIRPTTYSAVWHNKRPNPADFITWIQS